jgi:hypothetical protein
MPSLFAMIAVLFFGLFDFSANRSDKQPNTVTSMYESSETKLCGNRPAAFKGCNYICEGVVTLGEISLILAIEQKAKPLKSNDSAFALIGQFCSI